MMGVLLLAAPLLAAPPWSLPDAVLIQDDTLRLSCSPPWCEGELSIDAPPSQILNALLDLEHYPSLFPRIRSVSPLSADTYHLTLMMPFPLQDRDYAIRVVHDGEDLYFEPVPHPESSGVVRLPDFAGRWMLTADDQGGTVVRYIWHTDLGADIPGWAVQRAWVTQGNEVLGRLKLALESDRP